MQHNFCSVTCYTVRIWILIKLALANNILSHPINWHKPVCCIPGDKINLYQLIKWHSHSNSTHFGSWNSHSTNANFEQLRHMTKCNVVLLRSSHCLYCCANVYSMLRLNALSYLSAWLLYLNWYIFVKFKGGPWDQKLKGTFSIFWPGCECGIFPPLWWRQLRRVKNGSSESALCWYCRMLWQPFTLFSAFFWFSWVSK